jgi:transposase-like protein
MPCGRPHADLDDADTAEKLLRNLAQRLERDWSGVARSILEGIDEILTVTRLGLPKELRRSLACTNIIENVMSRCDGARPQLRCAGPQPPCRKPPKAFDD